LSVTGRSECCRSGSEISRAGLYQRQGAKGRCRSVEGGWLFNDLKKESRRRAWGTKSAALRTRDMRIHGIIHPSFLTVGHDSEE
jgi:hypothetical protein